MSRQRVDIEVVHEDNNKSSRSRAKLVVTVGQFIVTACRDPTHPSERTSWDIHDPPEAGQPEESGVRIYPTSVVAMSDHGPAQDQERLLQRQPADCCNLGTWRPQGPYYSMDEAEDQRCSDGNRRCSKRAWRSFEGAGLLREWGVEPGTGTAQKYRDKLAVKVLFRQWLCQHCLDNRMLRTTTFPTWDRTMLQYLWDWLVLGKSLLF